MKTLRAVDAVIVGGGWAGLLMAKELGARTPLSVVVLERGEPHTAGPGRLHRRNGRTRLRYPFSSDAGLLAGDGHFAPHGP